MAHNCKSLSVAFPIPLALSAKEADAALLHAQAIMLHSMLGILNFYIFSLLENGEGFFIFY